MPLRTPTPTVDTPTEHLAGTVERVTFHSEETGFCVLRVKVRGHRDLVTVVGTAPTITPGEYIELPIRPINFQLSVFQAARREQRLSLAIGGCPSVTLTRV